MKIIDPDSPIEPTVADVILYHAIQPPIEPEKIQVLKKRSTQWKCEECGFNNDFPRTECTHCKTKRIL